MTPILKTAIRVTACIATVVAIVATLYPMQGLADRPYTTAILSLLAVLFVSVFWGVRYTVFPSIVAAIGLNFLVPPYGHFHITKLRPWTALATYLIAGITANRLSERARRAVLAAQRSEKELRDLIENVPAMVFIALPGPSNEFVSR